MLKDVLQKSLEIPGTGIPFLNLLGMGILRWPLWVGTEQASVIAGRRSVMLKQRQGVEF